MTTTALRRQTVHHDGLELLVSRLAVGMLRWSQHHADRRRITHEQMMLLRQVERDVATAVDLSRLGRLG